MPPSPRLVEEDDTSIVSGTHGDGVVELKPTARHDHTHNQVSTVQRPGS